MKELFTDMPLFHILIFKTNIRYKKDIKLLEPMLNKHPDVARWNIDLSDIDKVLRVESTMNNSQQIIIAIREAGYLCEELPG